MRVKLLFKTILLLLSTLYIFSCSSSFLLDQRSTNAASKSLSKSEVKAETSTTVNNEAREVFKATEEFLGSRKGEAIMSYSYNKGVKQYTNNQFYAFVATKNKNLKGAVVSSKKNLFLSRQRLILVYIDPLPEGGTEIRVYLQGRSDITDDDVIKGINATLSGAAIPSATEESNSAG